MRRFSPPSRQGLQSLTAAWRLSKRKGVEFLELILVMPILFIATLAIFEFGILLLYEEAVTAAVVEGAREAAKTTNDSEVANVVQSFLAIHDVIFDTTTISNGGGNAYVLIERGPAVGERGNLNYAAAAYGPNPLSANEVRVTVSTPLVVANDKPVPNWLRYFGFNLGSGRMQVSSLTQAE
jgi:Flp pilus assembly protein TadG